MIFNPLTRLLCCTVLTLLSGVLVASVAGAVEIGLLHYEVSDLRTGETATLEQFRGKPTVLLIYEPGCRFCARQSRILNGMLRECDRFQVVALGVNGSRRKLLDYLDTLRPEFPAYMAGSDLLFDLGEVVITPVMMLADAQGNYELHMLGLQDREKMNSVLGQVSVTCP